MKMKSLIAVLLMAGTLAMGQKVKSPKEGEAVNAVLTATTPDQRIAAADKELALSCLRAWNDFMFDWCSVAPSMFVPMSLIQLWDVDAAVKETKRCLDKGFVLTGPHLDSTDAWPLERVPFVLETPTELSSTLDANGDGPGTRRLDG